MSRTKLLLDVVEDMRSLADSLSTLAHAMMDSDTPKSGPAEPAVSPTDGCTDSKPAVSLVEVRTRLGELSRAGYTAQIRELIQKYGAERLGEVDPSHLGELLKEAEALSNAT